MPSPFLISYTTVHTAGILAGVIVVLALVLFVQSILLLRLLILTRQRLLKYLLFLIPFAMSIWSFKVGVIAFASLFFRPGMAIFLSGHINPVFLAHIYQYAGLILTFCAFQIILEITVFAISLFLEKKFLPRAQRRPVWSLQYHTF